MAQAERGERKKGKITAKTSKKKKREKKMTSYLNASQKCTEDILKIQFKKKKSTDKTISFNVKFTYCDLEI